MEKYTPDVLGKGPVTWIGITISSGAEIKVGKIEGEHPKGVGDFTHKIYSNGSNGKETVLEFSLSKEACLALIQLYFDHGILDDSNVTCDLRGNQTSGMKIVRFTA